MRLGGLCRRVARLDHERRPLDPHDPDVRSDRRIRTRHAPGAVVYPDAALAGAHRRIEREDATDERLAAAIERGVRPSFCTIGRLRLRPTRTATTDRAGKDQGRDLP